MNALLESVQLNNMTKIYTKKGDTGLSSTINQHQLSKDSPVFQVIGAIDELQGWIGKANCYNFCKNTLSIIQSDLMYIGAKLAGSSSITDLAKSTTWMEGYIDQLEALMPSLNSFILPSSPEQSELFIARSVCRRAERNLVKYSGLANINLDLEKQYINRLSDLLFVLSRYALPSNSDSPGINDLQKKWP